MRRNLGKWLMVAGLALAIAPASANGRVDGAAAFERLKALEGTWEAAAKDGKKATTVFELTAAGTVLLERYSNPAFPDGHEMITAYHVDGGDLVLTHYCIAKNQPTLRAERYDAAKGELQFEFLRASNLKSPSAGHMRRARYVLTDANHFVTEWEFFEDGAKKFAERESFTRIK